VKAFQDYYPDNYSHCYGCGKLNKDGYHLKSYWDGEQSVCHFDPQHYHTGGFPDYLYGGLIASLVDCHSAATAAAARCRADGHELGQQPLSRYVTASLKIDYLKPTPVKRVTLRSNVVELKERKVIIETSVFADDIVRAKGEAIMVRIPDR
jgi:acyl-coenzyme A thioesterase PaaI-like protein